MSGHLGFSNSIAGGEGTVKYAGRHGDFSLLVTRGKGLRNNRKAIRAKKNRERNDKLLEKKLAKLGKLMDQTSSYEEGGYDFSRD